MKQRADKKKQTAIMTYQSLLCLQNPAQKHVRIVICHCIYTGHYPRIAGTPYHSRNWLSAMSSRSALYKHRNCIFNQTFNQNTTVKKSIKLSGKSNMYLILILFVPHISSNTFATNKREFKGIPRTITQQTFLENLQSNINDRKGM